MKLSQVPTERAADMLCELTPYISNIVTDEELLDELKNAIEPDTAATKAEWLAMGVSKINKLVPIVLKKRKSDVIGILAVLNEKTESDISKQRFIVTMKQVREIIRDKELIDFFKSCVDSDKSA